MTIAILSAFRDSLSRGQLPRFLDQVEALRRHAGPIHSIRVVAVEGDSRDGTYAALQKGRAGLSIELIKWDHGLPWFASVESVARFVAMSHIGNLAFGAVRDDDDAVLWVESDLIWDAHTIGSLADMAVRRDGDFDVFAPLIFAGEHFYDVWGYRGLDGARVAPFHPYHSTLRHDGAATEVSSVGSCLAMRGEVARACRVVDAECLVGFCRDARSKGYRVAVDPRFSVRHP